MQITLNAQDFLIHQLFLATQDDKVRRTRLRNRLLIPIVFNGLAFICVWFNQPLISIVLFIMAIVWLVIYPIYDRRQYKATYLQQVQTNHQNEFEQPTQLSIQNQFLNIKDHKGSFDTPLNQIAAVTKLKTHYFVSFHSGHSLIIPQYLQNGKLNPELDAFIEQLLTVGKLGITDNTKWKWK